MTGPDGETSQAAGAVAAVGGREPSKRLWKRPLVLAAVLLAGVVLARVLGIGEKLAEVRLWLISLGPWGPVVFVLIYIVAVVAAFPGTAISIAAGALFGSVLGVVLVSIGATVGGALAFLISRYFAREAVDRWLARSEKFHKLDLLTAEHGAIIVALTRLVLFLPFNVLNYGFGLTQVPFWTYVFWSWLGEIPGTILYVVGSDAVAQALSQGSIPWTLVTIFVAALCFLTILVRHARRQLQQKVAKTLIDRQAAGEKN